MSSLEKEYGCRSDSLELRAAAGDQEICSPFSEETVEPENSCHQDPFHPSLPKQKKHFLRSVTSEALMEKPFRYWKSNINGLKPHPPWQLLLGSISLPFPNTLTSSPLILLPRLGKGQMCRPSDQELQNQILDRKSRLTST